MNQYFQLASQTENRIPSRKLSEFSKINIKNNENFKNVELNPSLFPRGFFQNQSGVAISIFQLAVP
jgi:hypothetical protein